MKTLRSSNFQLWEIAMRSDKVDAQARLDDGALLRAHKFVEAARTSSGVGLSSVEGRPLHLLRTLRPRQQSIRRTQGETHSSLTAKNTTMPMLPFERMQQERTRYNVHSRRMLAAFRPQYWTPSRKALWTSPQGEASLMLRRWPILRKARRVHRFRNLRTSPLSCALLVLAPALRLKMVAPGRALGSDSMLTKPCSVRAAPLRPRSVRKSGSLSRSHTIRSIRNVDR